MPEAIELLDYWLKYPPTHLLLREQQGMSSVATKVSKMTTQAELVKDLGGVQGISFKRGRN